MTVGFFGRVAPLIGAMRARWTMTPYSVINMRDGEWIRRKEAWMQLGIRGEMGRKPTEGDRQNATYRITMNEFGHQLARNYRRKEAAKRLSETLGQEVPTFGEEIIDENVTGVSVFDPVLTEIAYRWFCPDGGTVLDPFAGGSTRGIVAEVLGHRYTGVEIRQEQIDVNVEQAREIGVSPNWLQGDSFHLDRVLPAGKKYDLLFTCPPYYDREVYSSDLADGSTHPTYEEFIVWYRTLFHRAIEYIHDNRFVVVVVGEIRNKANGVYRNLVGDTIQTFMDGGLHYYNEIILLTRPGSLYLRTGYQFEVARKIGKTHQNMLVFWKGDPSKVKDVFGPKEVKVRGRKGKGNG